MVGPSTSARYKFIANEVGVFEGVELMGLSLKNRSLQRFWKHEI